MSNLRSRLIRIAHESEALRPHLLPLLKEGARVPWERDLEYMNVRLPPNWPAAAWRTYLERGRDALLKGKYRAMFADRLGDRLPVALTHINEAVTLSERLQKLQDDKAEIEREILSVRSKASEIAERLDDVLAPLNRP